MAIDMSLLGSLDEMFNEVKANPETQGFVEWPQGTYQGVFVEANLMEAAKKKTPGLTINVQADVEGSLKNHKKTFWLSEGAIQRSLNELRRLFLSLGAPEELGFQEMIAWVNKNAVEHAVEVKVGGYKSKKSNEYVNVGDFITTYDIKGVDPIDVPDDDPFGGESEDPFKDNQVDVDEPDEDDIFGD
jgi:hypothetical protein